MGSDATMRLGKYNAWRRSIEKGSMPDLKRASRSVAFLDLAVPRFLSSATAAQGIASATSSTLTPSAWGTEAVSVPDMSQRARRQQEVDLM
eukprot:1742798-Rhodomonas_salina.1